MLRRKLSFAIGVSTEYRDKVSQLLLSATASVGNFSDAECKDHSKSALGNSNELELDQQRILSINDDSASDQDDSARMYYMYLV